MRKTKTIILKLYAEKSEGQWTAVCLDFSLAAQGDSSDEAVEKLLCQVRSYVEDAVGIDSEHREALLNRKAPINQWVHYYWLRLALNVKGLLAGVTSSRATVPSHVKLELAC